MTENIEPTGEEIEIAGKVWEDIDSEANSDEWISAIAQALATRRGEYEKELKELYDETGRQNGMIYSMGNEIKELVKAGDELRSLLKIHHGKHWNPMCDECCAISDWDKAKGE